MRIGDDAGPFWAVLLMGAAGLAMTALMLKALVQIAQRPAFDPMTRAIWILIVLVAPVLGAIAWFWIGPKEIEPSSRAR
ncbi:PLD nuclease N-terminal domain-containing protein [Paenarthrobacter sp. NPDC091711]|uniref:PLD nuclease N-terminal domain-containing protein n=1 Tax=Paenarthrobacter sp. NPDC091711 TaxID=3364385 RepID=UPI0038200E1D